MTAVGASHHEKRAAMVWWLARARPPVGPALGVVLERCHHQGQPWTPALRLPHLCDGLSALPMGGVVSVAQALQVSPRAPRMPAQRGARFDHLLYP